MSFKSFATALSLLVAQALPSHAAVIDFSALTTGFQGTSALSLPNVDVVGFGNDLFIFDATINGTAGLGAVGGFCPITDGFCLTSAAIGFTLGPVSNLTFEVFSFDEGDSVTALVFSDPVAPALASRMVSASGAVSFAGISGITSLVLFDTGSTGGGVFYGNFSFTQDGVPPVSAIPLPAGLPILLTALGAFGLARRRRT